MAFHKQKYTASGTACNVLLAGEPFSVVPPEYVNPIRGVFSPSPFVPRILLSKMLGVLQGPRALYSHARGASEGCFPRAQGCFCIRGCSACWCHGSGALPRRRE